MLALLAYAPLRAGAQVVRWGGNFAPCPQHAELFKHDPMILGVKLSTSNAGVRKAFIQAMDFWSTIVEMSWYEADSSSCAINVVDGTPAILSSAAVARSLLREKGIHQAKDGITVAARSQLPQSIDFEGWVAFNPRLNLPEREMYLNAIHEIGHLLGLNHNPDPASVMYFADVRGAQMLDRDDLAELAARHKLRIPAQHNSIKITGPRGTPNAPL